MTDKRLLSAILVMTMLMAGAGAAFYGSVIEGGISAIGSLDLGGLLLKDEDNDAEPNQTQTWTSGACTCTLDDVTGVFTVTGNGAMDDYTTSDETDPDFDPDTQPPWYSVRSQITSLIVEDGVTAIGKSSFDSCSRLVSVQFPDTLTIIRADAFVDCTSLAALTIPDSVTTIGLWAFMNCRAIASIIIGSSVTTINSSAFQGCYQATSIIIGSSVTTINSSAFQGCYSVTSLFFTSPTWIISGMADEQFDLGISGHPATCTVYSPNNVADGRLDDYHIIGGYTTLTYESSSQSWTSGDCTCTLDLMTGAFAVTGNGQMADYGQPNVQPWQQYLSDILSLTVGNGVTKIGSYNFGGCSNLQSVSLGSISAIGDRAFASCISLTSVTIPNSVTTINSQAFSGCYSLTSIEFTSPTWNITTIGGGAFSLGLSAHPAVCTVTSPGNVADQKLEAYKGSYTTFSYISSLSWTSGDCTLTLDGGWLSVTGNGAMADYTASQRPPWYDVRDQIRFINPAEGVTKIGAYAFADCTQMGHCAMPASLQTVGEYAFGGCTQFRLIHIGAGVTTIGASAFAGCTQAEAVFIDAPTWTVTSIGSDAFSLGTAMSPVTAYVYSENNMADGRLDAYKGADTSFIYRTEWASGDCTVTLENGHLLVTGSGDMADYSSESRPPWYDSRAQVTSLTVDYTVGHIGAYAFADCTALASVEILSGPDNDGRMLGEGAFYGCSALTSVIVPAGFTAVGDRAFYNCSALASVSLPDGLTSIGIGSFYNTAITSVTPALLPSTLTSVGMGAFESCEHLAEAILPDGITWGASVFAGCTVLESVALPDGMTQIPEGLLYQCPSLEAVLIPAAVTSVGPYAFSGCTSLTSITFASMAWQVTTIGTDAFALGDDTHSVTCTVLSVRNSADGRLDAYKNQYTTFTYEAVPMFKITFTVNAEGWGTVSTASVDVFEGTVLTVNGMTVYANRAPVPAAVPLCTASPSQPTQAYYYIFESWGGINAQGETPVTADMTITALFVRASVVPVSVLPQEYVDLDASPSYTGAEQVTDLPSWLSLDGTHLKGQVPAQNDIGSALIYWAKESVPRQDWTAYYYVFTVTAGKEIELSAGATQDIGSDGTMAILGHGDLTEAMCDMLTPFRDIVTVVDIRGLTSIRAMPEISNQFTLVLGDTVTNYRDQSDSNHFDAVAIGAGIQSFSVPGFTAFDKDGKQITGRELQGRVLKEERARQYIEVGVIDVENHYHNATVYAVKGSTMDNSADDRIVFSVQEDAPSLPNYLRTMLQGAQSSWNVNITTAFKNLQVGQDGVLRGVQADKTGTYTGAQTASMTSSEWGQMYSCTVMQSLAFTAYIADKLEVTS